MTSVGRRVGAIAVSELGGWTLGERLGAGGMGVVHRATRAGQQVALKVIHPELAADPEFRRRFRREVTISRLVDGPHLARVVDFDVEGDRPWLATELLEGPTLADAVRRHGPLGGPALVDVATGMAAGLADLHAAGIVHRDVKPANVVLTAAGPVLVDFGIAAAADLTSMTGTGTRLGSAGWMSPEQVEGRPVTPAADVFSWGATVAFAATGHNPYGSGASEAMLYRIVHHQPDLADVPPVWRHLLGAALDRRPDRRPSAAQLVSMAGDPAGAVLTDVTVVLTSVPPTVVRPSRPSRPSRRAVPAVLAAVLVLVLIAVAGWAVARSRDDAGSEPGSATPASSGPPGSPSASGTTEGGPGELPLLARSVDVGDPQELAAVGDFFAAHVQQDLRVDLDWNAVTGSLEGSEGGGLVVEARCAPTCEVEAIQSLLLSVDGLPGSDDVTFSGVGSSWRTTGTFFVQSATVENSGVYQVSLRVGGTTPTATATTPPAPEPPEPTGRCDVVEQAPVGYPGDPMSVADAGTFRPEVLVVQDLLNVQVGYVAGLSCIAEDGFFSGETDLAVRLFQRSYGLDDDGVVGERTYAMLMLYYEGQCPIDGC